MRIRPTTTRTKDTLRIAASKAQHCSRTRFRNIHVHSLPIHESAGCRARFHSWGCRGATVAQSLPSHALTDSIPPDRPLPHSSDPLYLPDPLSLQVSFSLSLSLSFLSLSLACLSQPPEYLSSRFLSRYNIPTTDPSSHSWSGGAFSKRTPRSDTFPLTESTLSGSTRGSAGSPAALTALTALTALSHGPPIYRAGRRKFEKLAHDRPIGPRTPFSSREIAARLARPYASHACGFLMRQRELRDITCCWHGKSPNVSDTRRRGGGRDERADRDREHLYRLNSVVLSRSYQSLTFHAVSRTTLSLAIVLKFLSLAFAHFFFFCILQRLNAIENFLNSFIFLIRLFLFKYLLSIVKCQLQLI